MTKRIPALAIILCLAFASIPAGAADPGLSVTDPNTGIRVEYSKARYYIDEPTVMTFYNLDFATAQLTMSVNDNGVYIEKYDPARNYENAQPAENDAADVNNANAPGQNISWKTECIRAGEAVCYQSYADGQEDPRPVVSFEQLDGTTYRLAMYDTELFGRRKVAASARRSIDIHRINWYAGERASGDYRMYLPKIGIIPRKGDAGTITLSKTAYDAGEPVTLTVRDIYYNYNYRYGDYGNAVMPALYIVKAGTEYRPNAGSTSLYSRGVARAGIIYQNQISASGGDISEKDGVFTITPHGSDLAGKREGEAAGIFPAGEYEAWYFMEYRFGGDKPDYADPDFDPRAAVLKFSVGRAPTPIDAADAPASWAEADVTSAIEKGLVPQELRGKYAQAATRAEFCALAVALYERTKGEEITGRAAFDDTADVNVEKAAAIGIVNGMGNGKFDPDAELTREQAATLLARLAAAAGSPLPESPASFADKDKISSWALDGVGRVQAAGIMGGVGNNAFSPQGVYTREQSIVTMLRLFGKAPA